MLTVSESQFLIDELVLNDAEADDRRWLAYNESTCSMPLMFDPRGGTWASIFKARGAGNVQRHRHACPVTAWTLDGAWGYRERDWIARSGTFIFEPAGDIHTLYVHPEAGHMKVLFHGFGPLAYLDDQGNVVDYIDVHMRIGRYAEHCRKVGLGEDFVRTLIR